LLEQPLDLDDGEVAQRTGSGTGNDDSLGSIVDSLLDELPVKALVAEVHDRCVRKVNGETCKWKCSPVKNIDHGELVDRADVESLLESRLTGRVIEERLGGKEPSDVTLLDGSEGVDGIGIVLLSVEGASDTVVERDEGTSVPSVGLSSEGDGFQEVGGTISGDGSRRPHSSHEHDWLAAVDDAVH
jgi:hypothetical protein